MGIKRRPVTWASNGGPSMAFSIPWAAGLKPVTALTAICQTRPIAGISYGDEAQDWWYRMTDTPAPVTAQARRSCCGNGETRLT